MKSPKRKLARPEMAAVAVMRSRLTPMAKSVAGLEVNTHRCLLTFFADRIAVDGVALSPVLQITRARTSSLGNNGGLWYILSVKVNVTRSVRVITLTAMMYAIVAKVVAPARISVRSEEPGISLG